MMKETIQPIGLAVCLAMTALASAGTAADEVFDVRDFGAAGDGRTVNTAAFQSAIDAAAGRGGGTVTVRSGRYVTGSVFLKNGVTFHVAKDATVVGSRDPADYNPWDVCPQNWRSVEENHEGGHLFLAIEQKNVAICGEGTIDGNGEHFMTHGYDRSRVGKRTGVNKLGECNPQDAILWRPAQMLYFVECDGVKVSGLNIRNAPYWSIYIYGCVNVKVGHLDVRTSPLVHNGDGIAIDCCENVEVGDCVLETSDDSFDLRADSRLLKVKRDCAHIAVSNLVLRSGEDTIRIGVGDRKVRDARISNITIKGARKAGINFSGTWFPSRGVDFEDILISDVDATCADFCRIHRLMATEPTVVRGIHFSNIVARTEKPMRIWAAPGAPFEDITFDNVRMDSGLEAFNVDGLKIRGGTLREVEMSAAERAAKEKAYIERPMLMENRDD